MVPSFPAYEHGNGAAAKEPVQLGSVRVCVCLLSMVSSFGWRVCPLYVTRRH